jgi:hypothetical protein
MKKIDPKNSFLTLVFSGHRLLPLNILPKGCTMNRDYFCDVILHEDTTAARVVIDKAEIEEPMIHIDNCKVLFLERPREN